MGYRQRLLRSVLAVLTTLTLVMLILPVTDTALASSVEPETVTGNPTCGDFTDGGTQLKIENPSDLTTKDSGKYTDGVLVVDLDIYQTSMGLAFDWSSNLDVDVVVAKGGPVGNVYRYGSAVTGDTGLHSPLNPHSGKWYGLSHISLCYSPSSETTVSKETSTSRALETSTMPAKESSTTSAIKSETTATTAPAEVLPTHLTTSTTVAEAAPAEELPFTGMSARLWILGVSLLGAGLAALALARDARTDEE